MRRVALAILTAVCLASCVKTLPDQDRRIVSAPPDVKLSADMLWKDFQENASDAASRYHGRVVVVSGAVTSVNADAASPSILFALANDKGVVARLLDDQAPAILKTATAGDRLTLKCFCEGLDGSVILKSCIRP
jgi:hypothetical protein